MKYQLPEGFIVGASQAAWQTEGWTAKKHDNYVDYMYKQAPNRWFDGIGPTIACDFYNRYKEDIALMPQVGLQANRFSIDWSRFIEDFETATVNEEGAQFYDNVVDEMLAKGVEPMICLEHWELPYELYEKYGGYASKHVIELYVKYAEQVFKRYSGRVKHFWTFNEPGVIPELCFLHGNWAPSFVEPKTAFAWNYGKVVATAKAVKLFREGNYEGKIGTILNLGTVYARSNHPRDLEAKRMAELFNFRFYMDSLVHGIVPQELIEILAENDCALEITAEETAIIAENTIEILGINYYQPGRVKARETQLAHTFFHPDQYFEHYDMQGKRMNPHRGWEIYPKALYDLAKTVQEEYKNIEWMIMENGMGVEGEEKYKNEDLQIQDDYRIEFFAEHLAWLLRAVEEGSNCSGYLVWNFMDNISPYNALKNRYGLVEMDLTQDRARRIKKSGEWFYQMSTTREFELATPLDPELK
ncbi:MAG: glycoside hydrolase family 1 protein [Culicoidibacterales bacterium]